MGEESDWYTVVPIPLDGGGGGGGKRREEGRGTEREKKREKNGSEKERGAKCRDGLGGAGQGREDWKRSSSTLSKPEVVPGFVLKSLRSRRHFQPR